MRKGWHGMSGKIQNTLFVTGPPSSALLHLDTAYAQCTPLCSAMGYLWVLRQLVAPKFSDKKVLSSIFRNFPSINFIYWTISSLHCLWLLCQQFLSPTWFSATSKLERLRQIERVTDSLNGEVDRHSAKIYGLQEIKARRCHHRPRSRPANAALCLSG